MSNEIKFLPGCLEGRYDIADIDAFIERWHSGAGHEELADFLGFSAAEWAAWVKNDAALPIILNNRRRAA